MLLLAEPKGPGRFGSLGCFGSNFEVCGSSEYAALIELVIVTDLAASTPLQFCTRATGEPRMTNDDDSAGLLLVQIVVSPSSFSFLRRTFVPVLLAPWTVCSQPDTKNQAGQGQGQGRKSDL